VTVTVGGGIDEKTVTTSVAGLAVFEKVPPGQVVITEGSPDLRTVRVFCGTASSGFISRELANDTVEVVAGSGEAVTCYWFTIDTTVSRITVYKYACPDDFVPAGQPYDEVLLTCPTTLEGVRFDFDASGQNYDLTDDEGIAAIRDVTPGEQTITETPPAEYHGAIVFCREVAPGQPEPAFSQTPVDQLSITYDVEGGNLLECHWFNTKTAYATVTITKYACPTGYLPKQQAFDTVLEKCATPLKDVTFELGAPAAEISRKTDASGVVTWTEVLPGPLFISETPPVGYTGAVVYCAVQPYGEPVGAFEQVPVEHFSIEREVAAGDTLACAWFNLSPSTHPGTPTPSAPSGPGNPGGQPGTPARTPVASGPATLILTTYTCPAGYDLFDPDAKLDEDCDETAADIAFSLTSLDDAAASPVELAGVTDGDGVVTFATVVPGPWLLVETLPEETETAFVATCSSNRRELQPDNPFTPFAYLNADGQLGVTLLPGETLECEVYNIPEQDEAA
jgi:hypothetical protein